MVEKRKLTKLSWIKWTTNVEKTTNLNRNEEIILTLLRIEHTRYTHGL